MTRRDYLAIADILRDARKQATSSQEIETIGKVAYKFREQLSQFPNFDGVSFVRRVVLD